MVKLLMMWDIKPGRETAYLDFVNQQLTPSLLKLGLEPSEVWYTYWGNGPQILMGFVSDDIEEMKRILKDSSWLRLQNHLEEYVTNFQYKLIAAGGRFQL